MADKVTYVSGAGRAAFCHLLEPQEFPKDSGNWAYSLSLLFKKGSDEVNELLKIANHVLFEQFGEGGPKLPDMQNPFDSGKRINDERRANGKDPLDGYEDDTIVVKFKKKKSRDPQYHDLFKRPKFADPYGQEILVPDSDKIYSGMWCRVEFRCSYYPAKGGHKQGVGFWLGDVMKTADDTRFSGEQDVTSKFASFAKPSPAHMGDEERREARQASREASQSVQPATYSEPVGHDAQEGYDPEAPF